MTRRCNDENVRRCKRNSTTRVDNIRDDHCRTRARLLHRSVNFFFNILAPFSVFLGAEFEKNDIVIL